MEDVRKVVKPPVYNEEHNSLSCPECGSAHLAAHVTATVEGELDISRLHEETEDVAVSCAAWSVFSEGAVDLDLTPATLIYGMGGGVSDARQITMTDLRCRRCGWKWGPQR